jgi:hypothetical protein
MHRKRPAPASGTRGRHKRRCSLADRSNRECCCRRRCRFFLSVMATAARTPCDVRCSRRGLGCPQAYLVCPLHPRRRPLQSVCACRSSPPRAPSACASLRLGRATTCAPQIPGAPQATPAAAAALPLRRSARLFGRAVLLCAVRRPHAAPVPEGGLLARRGTMGSHAAASAQQRMPLTRAPHRTAACRASA